MKSTDLTTKRTLATRALCALALVAGLSQSLAAQADCGSQRAVAARTSHYFIPRVSSPRDRRCAMEGTCVYSQNGKEMIYNYGSTPRLRNKEQCPSGRGAAGRCLTPCESIAADLSIYKAGTTIFVPALKGVQCGGKTLDGYFTVADTGGAIHGHGRFDFFVGECKNDRNDMCHDEQFKEFRAKLERGVKFCKTNGRPAVKEQPQAQAPAAQEKRPESQATKPLRDLGSTNRERQTYSAKKTTPSQDETILMPQQSPAAPQAVPRAPACREKEQGVLREVKRVLDTGIWI